VAIPYSVVKLVAGYLEDVTPIAASGVGTTGANVQTLAAVAGKTTYIIGASISARATAAAALTFQLTGVTGGPLNYDIAAAAAPQVSTRDIYFNPPLPASAVNTAIVGTLSAPGAGGVSAVTLHGSQA
jgi:hypothetical protein